MCFASKQPYLFSQYPKIHLLPPFLSDVSNERTQKFVLRWCGVHVVGYIGDKVDKQSMNATAKMGRRGGFLLQLLSWMYPEILHSLSTYFWGELLRLGGLPSGEGGGNYSDDRESGKDHVSRGYGNI